MAWTAVLLMLLAHLTGKGPLGAQSPLGPPLALLCPSDGRVLSSQVVALSPRRVSLRQPLPPSEPPSASPAP